MNLHQSGVPLVFGWQFRRSAIEGILSSFGLYFAIRQLRCYQRNGRFESDGCLSCLETCLVYLRFSVLYCYDCRVILLIVLGMFTAFMSFV